MTQRSGPSTRDFVECVPNVSEGRRPDVIESIAAAARSVPGAFLLDVHSDADHHRSVFTMVGSTEAVAESAFRLAEVAILNIDMSVHRGTHPRIGALDVLPFVPLGETPMQRCVEIARQVGQRIGSRLHVPVYFYGEAAVRPERRALVELRRGEYEQLCAVIGSDPLRAPDVGPAAMGPGGATAVGARPPLIAFNVHLRTSELTVAQAIARAVRGSSGGLPGVQALGFPTSRPGIVQLSMNLTDLAATPLHVAVARVRAEALRHGVELAESELVGLMPASAALAAASAIVGLPTLAPSQVIELAVHAAAASQW